MSIGSETRTKTEITIQVSDGKYGGFDGARWNGMISEVLEGEADMAVADLSITTERLNAVEFSMPWMNLGGVNIFDTLGYDIKTRILPGISIIYIKPRKAPPSLLSFLEPFGNDVWITSLASIVLVSILTFLIGILDRSLVLEFMEEN